MVMQSYDDETMEILNETTLCYTSEDERLEYLDTEELAHLLGIPKNCTYARLTQIPKYGGVKVHITASRELIQWFFIEFCRRKTAFRFKFELDEDDFPVFEEDETLLVNLRTDNGAMGKDIWRYFGLCPAPYDKVEDTFKQEVVRDEVKDFLDGLKHVKGDDFFTTPLHSVYKLYKECMMSQNKKCMSKDSFIDAVGIYYNTKPDLALQDLVFVDKMEEERLWQSIKL